MFHSSFSISVCQKTTNERKRQRSEPHAFQPLYTLTNHTDDVHRTAHVKRESQNRHQMVSDAQAVRFHRRARNQQTDANAKQKRFVSERWYPRNHVLCRFVNKYQIRDIKYLNLDENAHTQKTKYVLL